MSEVAVTATCPACGMANPPGILACPGCHRLVHAGRLTELAQQASAAERAGDISQALSHWRESLDLLPAETKQRGTILAHVNELSRQLAGTAPSQRNSDRSPAGKALAGLGVFGMLLWKLKFVLVFALTKGKLLLLGLTKAGTFLSMFSFFAAYWALWGWRFALGLVLSIYIHEMGHVDALRRYGFKASAPMFIPGLGALVRLKQHPANPTEDARIGLAGPLWGMGAAMVSYAIYLATGNGFWASLAHLGALINIFNLIPLGSLDGGRGFGALSRTQALLITAAMAAAWCLSSEGMLLLVAIACVFRAFSRPRQSSGDRIAFATFVLLITILSALVCVRGTQSV